MIQRAIGMYKDTYITNFIEMNTTKFTPNSWECGTSTTIYDLVDTSSFTLVNYQFDQANFTFRFLGKKNENIIICLRNTI